jgi:hypothetical protein
MKRDLIRIGSDTFANKSALDKLVGFDLLYGRYHEFVYVPDSKPWLQVNGSWAGALGHMMNGQQNASIGS